MSINLWKASSFSLIIFFCIAVFIVNNAQEVNITSQLKLIESGQINKAREEFDKLKLEYPRDPSILYLDALLTSEAKDAVAKYTLLSDKYPRSFYADAALYKVYSYYYALGLYSSARNILGKLSKTYPQSPYVKLAEKKNASEPFVEEINPSVKENPGVPAKAENKNLKRFTIQAGAFLSPDNAKRLKETFIEDGYSSEIKLKEVAGSTLSVVSVGSFSSEEEAKASLLLINERYKLNGRIVPSEQ